MEGPTSCNGLYGTLDDCRSVDQLMEEAYHSPRAEGRGYIMMV